MQNFHIPVDQIPLDGIEHEQELATPPMIRVAFPTKRRMKAR